MEEKSRIRKEVFADRKRISDAEVHEKSLLIMEKILALPAYQESREVFVYVDAKHEVETMDFIRRCMADGKKVAAPKVRGKDMDFFHLETLDQLQPGYFGILEPAWGEIVDWPQAFMLIPGVAFDPACHRVGYGQGFYDRYLEIHDQHPTVALAFDFQIKEAVPFEETDICPQIVLTETTEYRHDRKGK